MRCRSLPAHAEVVSELYDETLARGRVLERLEHMSRGEVFNLPVRAGIYTVNGELTGPYRDNESEISAAPALAKTQG